MPRLLVFQHVAAEPLGTLNGLIRRRGHRVRFKNFERHPDAGVAVDRYRGLVVLGGPMNVEDYPHRTHLLEEMRAIETMLELGRPVLGICLGAQLLAHVLGAPIKRLPRGEVGWVPLRLTGDGMRDPVLGQLPAQTPVFQWHNYAFDIPASAQHLAASDACPAQAFRYGQNAYGFQFHLEMDEALIRRWLASPAYQADLREYAQAGGAQRIEQDTQAHIAGMQSHADAVFNAFLDLVGRPRRRYTLPSREFE